MGPSVEGDFLTVIGSNLEAVRALWGE